MKRLFGWCALSAWLLVWNPVVQAQGLTPQSGPGMGQQPPKEDKPAGPAEAAPEKDEEEVPDLPPIQFWPGQEKKKAQFFELHGYFRFRTDIFFNLNLGQPDSLTLRAPFRIPLSEQSNLRCQDRVGTKHPDGSDRDLEEGSCPSNTISGANMRLRLEPTIRPFGSEFVKVQAQIDVFDNLVLGSTPDSLVEQGNTAPNVPLSILSESQAPPVEGRNTGTPAILVKRAWAEVTTPVGVIKVGRMPSQWGLGILANNGSCWDCNYGDNADRILFTTEYANHFLSFGYDWAASGPTSFGINDGTSYYYGQAIDLENLDDVDQLIWIGGRIDKPEVIQEKIEEGSLVFNYGFYLTWRRQFFDYTENYVGITEQALAANFVERHAWALIPDLWAKLLWKKFYLEAEGVLVAGNIQNASNDPQTTLDQYDLLQFGWVVRSHYKFLKDKLKVGLEVGMASGDQTEPSTADINRRRTSVLQGSNDGALNEFRFDYDYHVDLILFRELIGTVANAMYFKPTIAYDIFADTLGASLDVIYGLAHKPVAFPGNSPHLGVELDLNVYYRNIHDGFFAGLQYGVLFPLPGLDRPADIYGKDQGCSDGDGPGCADIAHSLQAYLAVQF
ncbi:MAG: TIGR04551 family protein [Pseudomonadota bacterium]